LVVRFVQMPTASAGALFPSQRGGGQAQTIHWSK
jgi:hypothetical protein